MKSKVDFVSKNSNGKNGNGNGVLVMKSKGNIFLVIILACGLVGLFSLGEKIFDAPYNDVAKSLVRVDEAMFENMLQEEPVEDAECQREQYNQLHHYTLCQPTSLRSNNSYATFARAKHNFTDVIFELLEEDSFKTHDYSALVFLDLGAYLGWQSMCFLTSGFDVWIVEPQPYNLVRIYKSASLASGEDVMERMHLLPYSVGIQRSKRALMKVDSKNNQRAFLLPQEEENKRKFLMDFYDDKIIETETILLSDVFEDIKDAFPKVDVGVVVKMSMELSECGAILGSKEIFTDPRFNVHHIVMEWKFNLSPTAQAALGIGHLCPRSLLGATLELLMTHYDATGVRGVEDIISKEKLLRDNFQTVIWRKKGDIAYNSINGMR